MKTTLIMSVAVSALVLSACQNQAAETDAVANEAAAANTAAPVELPPAVVASNTYRCKDNSLVYIDFLSKTGTLDGSLMANLKTEQTGPVTMLTRAGGEADTPVEAGTEAGNEATAAAPTGDYVAEGYAVAGNGDTVTVTLPGKGPQSCTA